MTDRTPELEALAWAMCAAADGAGPGKCSPWAHCSCGWDAMNVIDALHASGWVITPQPIGAKLLADSLGT